MVKFATVCSISLSISSGITLSHLIDWSNTPRRRAILVALVVALLWQGMYYPFVFLQDYDPGGRPAFSRQMIRPYLSSTYPVDEDNSRAVSFLRTRMGPSEIVYRTEGKSEPYAIWGGLPTQASVYPAATGDNDAYGLGQEKLAARRNLAIASATWFDRLLRLIPLSQVGQYVV